MTHHDTDSAAPVLLLFRTDLRLHDNRALHAAAASGKPVIAVYVRDDGLGGIRALGGARRWWLHHSLESLTADLEAKGLRLVLRVGTPVDVVGGLVRETKAELVLWNRRYDPPAAKLDAELKSDLARRGIAHESFDGQLLHEPTLLKTGSGGPFKVYSPFWRAMIASGEPRDPVAVPGRLRAFEKSPKSDTLSDWKLLPTHPDWAGGLRETWEPGERGARRRLDAFLKSGIEGYGDGRDIPGRESTSRLSPHLAHGEISPHEIWHATLTRKNAAGPGDAEKFRKELAWREFSYHLLFHNPDLAEANFNARFDAFPWSGSAKSIDSWKRARTGYPIVDAGMRQLWQTGWIHNRVRMIVASFLIKHLMVDWREGEAWFWDTLVDADPANNAASWQWVAGSGADAAPYFRIFNPILQGEKFDGDGRFVRAFLPEIADLPDRVLHKPWGASKAELSKAGVKLGDTYPVPLVEHDRARQRALDAYQSIRGD